MLLSYNLVNGTYACSNDQLQNKILRSELGFQGFVVSDWGGQSIDREDKLTVYFANAM